MVDFGEGGSVGGEGEEKWDLGRNVRLPRGQSSVQLFWMCGSMNQVHVLETHSTPVGQNNAL